MQALDDIVRLNGVSDKEHTAVKVATAVDRTYNCRTRNEIATAVGL
jgi:hypothetical protein